jgi:tetratricopeptide (TPR) repeat protein
MRTTIPALLAVLLAAGGCASSPRPPAARDEWRKGVQAANRGYWQEAHFRFSRAHQVKGDDPKLLANLAVSLEALGRFDEALEMYKQAAELAPGNTQIRRNYARFAEFFSAYARGTRPRGGSDDTPD